MTRFLLSLILLVHYSFAAVANQPASPSQNSSKFSGAVFLSPTRLETLKQRIAQRIEPTYSAYLHVQKAAETALERQPTAPAEWYVPLFYEQREAHLKARQSIIQDSNSAYALALMYRLTGDVRYARAAARNIHAWATGVQTLRTEHDSKLSFSYHFPAFIFAADLIEDSPEWPKEQQKVFREFVTTKAIPMNTMAHRTNFGNWGLVLVLASAAYLQDAELFDKGIERWKELIESQIAEDGHMLHEVGRNGGRGERGISYSNFALLPQTIAAEIARVNGVDLYEYRSPSGRSLRLAFERLAPWINEPSTFPYYRPVHKGTTVPQKSALSSASYLEILNLRWPNAAASAMIAKSRPMSDSNVAPFITFTHGDLLNDG